MYSYYWSKIQNSILQHFSYNYMQTTFSKPNQRTLQLLSIK